jgi:hypothetical protein
MGTKTKSIKISEIRFDGGTQQRVEINRQIVSEYAESIRCGTSFPPVEVFFDGAQYWLVDGFHRFFAMREAEVADALCEIHAGTQREAVIFSAGVNHTHGLRLSREDKKKAVLTVLSDIMGEQWTDREIARHCHVSHTFVASVRTEKQNKLQAQLKVKSDAGNVATQPCKPRQAQTHCTETVQNDEKEPKKSQVQIQKTEKVDPAALIETVQNLQIQKEQTEDALEALRESYVSLLDKSASEVATETGHDLLAEITGLRAQIVTLERDLDAVKTSRDTLLTENAALKRQILSRDREIKKLRGGK